MNNLHPDIKIVGLGEALFDRFVGQDRTILGGAPLNMAFQSHQILSLFGGCGTVMTRVGTDELGDQIVASLEAMGMPTGNVQRDSIHATGDVHIRVEQDENHYSISPDVAWDYLEMDASADRLAKECHAVCFGTLAQRSEPSRRSIHRFIQSAANALIVFDVNLRQEFYNAEILHSSLGVANILKLNEAELQILKSELSLGVGDDDEMILRMIERYDLQLVALTRGAAGTKLLTADTIVEAEVPRVDTTGDVDTVGAGDASCAGLVCGHLLNWTLADTLSLSNRMGAYVASQPGATPSLAPELADWIRDRA